MKWTESEKKYKRIWKILHRVVCWGCECVYVRVWALGICTIYIYAVFVLIAWYSKAQKQCSAFILYIHAAHGWNPSHTKNINFMYNFSVYRLPSAVWVKTMLETFLKRCDSDETNEFYAERKRNIVEKSSSECERNKSNNSKK